MQAHEQTAITTALHPLKLWERFVDDPLFHSILFTATIFIKTLRLLSLL